MAPLLRPRSPWLCPLLRPKHPLARRQNPELQEQWAQFVAGSKADMVRGGGWWDAQDAQEQAPAQLADIDWNA